MNEALEKIKARAAEIRAELDKDGADFGALETELRAMEAEKEKLERREELNAIAEGCGQVVKRFESADVGAPESRTYTADSPEYRQAYFKNLLDQDMTEEQRAAFTHMTTNTPAVLPTTTVNAIWDLVSGAHCIMDDITIYRTGVTMDLIKHVSIEKGAAKTVKEGQANEDEENKFVKVTLSGKDFSKHIDLSYAALKMSIDAFEGYIVSEIGRELGRALAEDVFDQIKKDVNAENKVTLTADKLDFKAVAGGLAKLKRTNKVNLYCNYATLYSKIVSICDTTGRPIFQPTAQDGAMGVFLGATIRLDDALKDGEILIGDPQRVAYNMVTDVMIESDTDIKNHVVTISGYCRGEGVLMDDKSFALLTVSGVGA